MKGSIWAAAAFCCVAATSVLLTSCGKEVVPTNGAAVVSINTVALYDKLEITDLMVEKLDEGGTVVTDSVVVID